MVCIVNTLGSDAGGAPSDGTLAPELEPPEPELMPTAPLPLPLAPIPLLLDAAVLGGELSPETLPLGLLLAASSPVTPVLFQLPKPPPPPVPSLHPSIATAAAAHGLNRCIFMLSSNSELHVGVRSPTLAQDAARLERSE